MSRSGAAQCVDVGVARSWSVRVEKCGRNAWSVVRTAVGFVVFGGSSSGVDDFLPDAPREEW